MVIPVRTPFFLDAWVSNVLMSEISHFILLLSQAALLYWAEAEARVECRTPYCKWAWFLAMVVQPTVSRQMEMWLLV
jgi:hypothetical protein